MLLEERRTGLLVRAPRFSQAAAHLYQNCTKHIRSPHAARASLILDLCDMNLNLAPCRSRRYESGRRPILAHPPARSFSPLVPGVRRSAAKRAPKLAAILIDTLPIRNVTNSCDCNIGVRSNRHSREGHFCDLVLTTAAPDTSLNLRPLRKSLGRCYN